MQSFHREFIGKSCFRTLAALGFGLHKLAVDLQFVRTHCRLKEVEGASGEHTWD